MNYNIMLFIGFGLLFLLFMLPLQLYVTAGPMFGYCNSMEDKTCFVLAVVGWLLFSMIILISVVLLYNGLLELAGK